MPTQRLRTREHVALRLAIVAARKEVGITQQELARRLRRPRSYVSKVENGETKLGVVEFKRWMRALGTDDVAVYRRFSRWWEDHHEQEQDRGASRRSDS